MHGCHVQQFGADAFGTVDSTDAFQRAADAAAESREMARSGSVRPSGGYGVYIPPGKYVNTSRVTFQPGISVYGNGRSSCVFRPGTDYVDPEHPGEPIFMLLGNDSTCFNVGFLGTNGDADGAGFVAEGFGFQSAAVNFNASILDGIGMQRCTLSHCWFENLFLFPMHEAGDDFQSMIINNRMRYCANGLNPNGRKCIVSGNILYNAEGIELIGTEGIIFGNQISGNFNSGISAYGAGCLIAKNLVDMTETTSIASTLAIGISGGQDNTISGNVIINPALMGIQVYADQIPGREQESRGITITGNTIRNRRASRPGDPNHGIHVVSTKRVVIANNVIEGPDEDTTASHGISVVQCEDIVIDSNSVRGTDTASILLDHCNDAIIKGNLCKVPGAAGIDLQTCEDVIVTANIGKGSNDARDLSVDAACLNIRVSPDNIFDATLYLGATSAMGVGTVFP